MNTFFHNVINEICKRYLQPEVVKHDVQEGGGAKRAKMKTIPSANEITISHYNNQEE